MSTRGALPILTYHAIDSSRAVTSTDPARFAESLDALLAAGFRAVDLGESVNAGRPPVNRGFALVFDDGLRSVLGVADRLARLAVPATVFLLSARIGLDNAWPGQPGRIPTARLLGRADLESLARLGVRFGSHGRTHRRFDRLNSRELEDELIGSRDEIEQRVGGAATCSPILMGRRMPECGGRHRRFMTPPLAPDSPTRRRTMIRSTWPGSTPITSARAGPWNASSPAVGEAGWPFGGP